MAVGAYLLAHLWATGLAEPEGSASTSTVRRK